MNKSDLGRIGAKARWAMTITYDRTCLHCGATFTARSALGKGELLGPFSRRQMFRVQRNLTLQVRVNGGVIGKRRVR